MRNRGTSLTMPDEQEDDKLMPSHLDETQLRSYVKELLSVIKEKDENIKMAAEIGQSLLEANSNLKAAYDDLVQQSSTTSPVSMKSGHNSFYDKSSSPSVSIYKGLDNNPFYYEKELEDAVLELEETYTTFQSTPNRQPSASSNPSSVSQTSSATRAHVSASLHASRLLVESATPTLQRTSIPFTPTRSSSKREVLSFSRSNSSELGPEFSPTREGDQTIPGPFPSKGAQDMFIQSPVVGRRASSSSSLLSTTSSSKFMSPRFNDAEYATSLEHANAKLGAQLEEEKAANVAEKANNAKLQDAIEHLKFDLQRLVSKVEELEHDKERLVKEKLECRRELAAFMGTLASSSEFESASSTSDPDRDPTGLQENSVDFDDKIRVLEEKAKVSDQLRKDAEIRLHETIVLLTQSESQREELTRSAHEADQLRDQVIKLMAEAEELRSQLEEERAKYSELEANFKHRSSMSPWKAGIPGYSPLIGYPKSPYYNSQLTINSVFGLGDDTSNNSIKKIPFIFDKTIDGVDNSNKSSRATSPTSINDISPKRLLTTDLQKTTLKPSLSLSDTISALNLSPTKPELANMSVQTSQNSIYDEIIAALHQQDHTLDEIADNMVDDDDDDSFDCDDSAFFTPANEGVLSRQSSRSRMGSFHSAVDHGFEYSPDVDSHFLDSLSKEDGDDFGDLPRMVGAYRERYDMGDTDDLVKEEDGNRLVRVLLNSWMDFLYYLNK
ncbi:hypothetical protein HDV05_001965 [Chytridiales sp. JEL 0842]|nr:hypothetical protein HDV05_001965 [Chytridiales sp. JEL 0842]